MRIENGRWDGPADQPLMTEQAVRTYKAGGDMARGVQQMSADGWRVISQSSYTPRKGCLRMLAGGFLFFNRKPLTTVTYQRPV